MQIYNPHIVVKTPFFMKYFGYQYSVKLEFGMPFDTANLRSATEESAMHKYVKTKEEALEHIETIRSKITGKTVYLVGVDWDD